MSNQTPRVSYPSAPSRPPLSYRRARTRRKTVLTLFGTRPEVIKLAPVIQQLEARSLSLRTFNIASGQHSDLIRPFIEMFDIRVDVDFNLMTVNQTPALLRRRITVELHKTLNSESADLIMVQGDTTTALAGALVGNERGIPVAHVEAGLRSGNILSPCPEELNRRMITQLATYHFASTARNREALLREGVPESAIFLTGNPIVDAMQAMVKNKQPSSDLNVFNSLGQKKYIVLTTHRRESFGRVLTENLRVLSQFVKDHEDVVLVFPVHPNPNVSHPAREIFADNARVLILPPLPYRDFLHILSQSWLVVSDSGGIQEEVPTLGKPLLILRENTERPECIEAGVARLVGGSPRALSEMLEEAYAEGSWVDSVHSIPNPFGQGDSALRIVQSLTVLLEGCTRPESAVQKGSDDYR